MVCEVKYFECVTSKSAYNGISPKIVFLIILIVILICAPPITFGFLSPSVLRTYPSHPTNLFFGASVAITIAELFIVPGIYSWL